MLNEQTLQTKSILSLSQAQFHQFIVHKMYKINKNFNSSFQCIIRLIDLIKKMPVNKQTIRIAKNVIKYYGVGIIIFFQTFFDKINQKCKQLQLLKKKQLNQQNQLAIQSEEKLISKFKQLSSVGRKIIQPYTIQYLDFINIFGQEDNVLKTASRTLFQLQYLQFLKQASQKYMSALKIKIKKQQINFLNWLSSKKISRQFNTIQLLNLEQLAKKFKAQTQKKQTSQISKVAPSFKTQKQLKDDLSKIPLCCRQYFFYNQQILIAQSINLQYKNFRYPYDTERINIIRKTICGFLNGGGGTILIGIYEAIDNKMKFVKGEFYSQSIKQKLLTDFRYICQQVYPKIVNSQMYSVKFVPIRNQKNSEYIKGKYIVRIKIKAGNYQNMYSYYNDGQKNQYIAFRTANQVLKRSITQDILNIYRQRITSPPVYDEIHSGQCLPPQLGSPIFYEKPDDQENFEIQQAISISLQQKQLSESQNDPKTQYSNILSSSMINNNDNDHQVSVIVQKSQDEKNNQSFQSFIQNGWIIDKDVNDQNNKKKLQKQLKRIQQKQMQKKQIVSFKKPQAENNQNQENQNRQKVGAKRYVKKYVERNYNGKQNTKIQKNFKKGQYYRSQQQKQSSHVQNGIEYNNSYCNNQNHKNQQQRIKKAYRKKQVGSTSQMKLQYLFLSIPIKQIKQLAETYQIHLLQEPIKCKNDMITWLKVKHSKQQMQKIQLLKQTIKQKKLQYPKLQFTFISNILYTCQDQFKAKLRALANVTEQQKQNQYSIFMFEDTFSSIKAFLICWTPGQKRIKFARDKKKQETNKIINILK